MRSGPDVAADWETAAGAEPGKEYAIGAVVARSFMHRRLWLNDADCVMLRAKETGLSADERHALRWTVAASGGMLLISDDMRLLSEEDAILFRAAARIGAEVDAASTDEPPIARTLMEGSTLKIASIRTGNGA